MRPVCDVCGKPDGRLLTPGERAMWPSVAPWIKSACPDCRRGFRRRNGEKAAA